MNITSLIVVIALLLLIAIPIIIGHRKKVRIDNGLKAVLAASVHASGLSFSQIDVWDGIYAIGIDSDKRRVVHVRRTGDSQVETMADLSEATKCRVDVSSRSEKTPNGNTTVVESLNLVVTFRGRDSIDKRMEFFNDEIQPLLGGQKALADKWQEIVSSVIKAGHK